MRSAFQPMAALLILSALAQCGSSQSSTRATALSEDGMPTPVPSAPTTASDRPLPPPATGLCLTGAEAERFLATAEVTEIDEFDTKGITKPRRAVLTDGTRVCRAVFKDIEKTHDREQLSTGKWLLNLKDSYKHEIAAWKLDELLGLGLVPPCVERTIGRDTGSLCMWVEGAMTEYQRSQVDKVNPPDVLAYNDQMHDIKLFMQLTWETDYNNIANILIDGNWKLYKVDSSRAFRTDAKLRHTETLTRFRRHTVAALEALTRERLEDALAPWLDRKQIDGVWKRRGKILQRVDDVMTLQSEAAALYD